MLAHQAIALNVVFLLSSFVFAADASAQRNGVRQGRQADTTSRVRPARQARPGQNARPARPAQYARPARPAQYARPARNARPARPLNVQLQKVRAKLKADGSYGIRYRVARHSWNRILQSGRHARLNVVAVGRGRRGRATRHVIWRGALSNKGWINVAPQHWRGYRSIELVAGIGGSRSVVGVVTLPHQQPPRPNVVYTQPQQPPPVHHQPQYNQRPSYSKIVAQCGAVFSFSSDRNKCIKLAQGLPSRPRAVIRHCGKQSFSSEKFACMKRASGWASADLYMAVTDQCQDSFSFTSDRKKCVQAARSISPRQVLEVIRTCKQSNSFTSDQHRCIAQAPRRR